jgi:hypothetical protein
MLFIDARLVGDARPDQRGFRRKAGTLLQISLEKGDKYLWRLEGRALLNTILSSVIIILTEIE